MLENWKKEVLILREKQTKPALGKMAGMYSIPMETVRISEGENACEALKRLVEEEIPCYTGQVEFARDWHYAYCIPPNIWVLLYTGFTWRIDTPVIDPSSEEVGEHEWVSPSTLLQLWVRKGVREMTEDLYFSGFSGHKKRIRRRCTEPPMVMPEGTRPLRA
jgi:hypothetical protein